MVSRAGHRLWWGLLSVRAIASLVEITLDPPPQPTQLSALADPEVPVRDTSLTHTAVSPSSVTLGDLHNLLWDSVFTSVKWALSHTCLRSPL